MNIPKRRHYSDIPLKRIALKENPLEQFQLWFDEAVATSRFEANAMILSTATKEGRPSSRTVLLKGLDPRGFIFYTNYESRKGREIEENPIASLTFAWLEYPRQVIVEGSLEKISQEQSRAYFSTRPRRSQIAAFVSQQGKVLTSRKELEQAFDAAEKKYEGREIPLPENWGGYLVKPTAIEFWQGRRDRLHDRFLYRKEGEVWVIERLSP